MYPFFRLAKILISSPRRAKIEITDSSKIDFYCRPWDIDMFLEMNNGRIFTLYDLGRFDLAIRSGLGQQLKQNKWGLVVAGSTIRYRKRVKLFDQVVMKTKLVAVDEKWMYISQSSWVKNEACSSALLRVAVTKNGRLLANNIVFEAMGYPDFSLEPRGWVKAWIDADSERTWPPED